MKSRHAPTGGSKNYPLGWASLHEQTRERLAETLDPAPDAVEETNYLPEPGEDSTHRTVRSLAAANQPDVVVEGLFAAHGVKAARLQIHLPGEGRRHAIR